LNTTNELRRVKSSAVSVIVVEKLEKKISRKCIEFSD